VGSSTVRPEGGGGDEQASAVASASTASPRRPDCPTQDLPISRVPTIARARRANSPGVDETDLRGLDEAGLTRAARRLGALASPGTAILLVGPMGAGKTTWTRAFAEGLGIDRPERVRSPTFNLCLSHPGRVVLHHVDLFRLSGFDTEGTSPAFEALGLDDLLEQPDAVSVIEWADLVWDRDERRFETDHLWIELTRPQPERRDLAIEAHRASARALLQAWMDDLASNNDA